MDILGMNYEKRTRDLILIINGKPNSWIYWGFIWVFLGQSDSW